MMSARRPAVVLVYSLLVLSTLLIIATAFSLYVLRGTRTLAVASDTAVANYVAESGVEEGLFLLRHESEAVANPVHAGDLETPLPRDIYEDGEIVGRRPGDPLASIASSTNPADAGDVQFFSPDAFAELKVTSTSSEIVMDVPEDQVAYADVYDASQPVDLIGSSIQSIEVQWDGDEDVGWLEASLVELNAQSNNAADLRPPRTTVLGPSFHGGYCFSDLHVVNLANIHRFRFRALYDDIHNLRVIGYAQPNCPQGAYHVPLPGHTSITATGKYRQAKQTVQITMPQHNLPSGLFGFVVFSDQSLVKLNAGSGNLEFWPRIDAGHVWPDGVAGAASTFRFTYPTGGGAPGPSSTVSLSGTYLGTAPDYLSGTPIFTLVNTSRSGTAFDSGDITLDVSGNYSGALSLDYSFSSAILPTYPAANPALKKCNDPALQVEGHLRLAAAGTPPLEERAADDSITDVYYVDRCAVGISMSPSEVTVGNPLRGRLVAFADPGGTASMGLQWDRPAPQVYVEQRHQLSDPWMPVLNNTIYNFGGIAQGSATTTHFRLCNVGGAGTTLTVSSVTASNGPSGVGFGTSNLVNPPAGLAATSTSSCAGAQVATFDVSFSAPSQVAYDGTLDVASNAAAYQASLRGSSAIAPPDRDGKWDCWGLGDTDGDAQHLNEIKCEWGQAAGAVSYDIRYSATCSDETHISNPSSPLGSATILVSGATCNGATCWYTYNVSGDTAATTTDDRFRCHQIRVFDGTSQSDWSTVRGTTGATAASPGTHRFFLAYTDSGFVSTTFSGNLHAYANSLSLPPPYSWQLAANQLCTRWASQKLGITGSFYGMMCGKTSNVPSCQLLAGDATYVWLDSGARHLPGVSFRTTATGVPPSDFWRGGSTISCGSTTECSTQREHVYSTNGVPADDNAQYFRTAMSTNGLSYTGGGDCIVSNNSWEQSTGNMTYIGEWGQFGSGRWNSNITRANACQADANYAIYCAEVMPLNGAPSGFNVTWVTPFNVDASWTDVVGETNYRFGVSTPASFSRLLPANQVNYSHSSLNSINLGLPVSGDLGSACQQVRATTTNPWAFYVDATDGMNWSPRSTDTATRPGWELPTGLRIHYDSTSQITLRWNDNSSFETGYVVYNGGTVVATTSANAVSLAVSVTNNTLYTFKVRPFITNPASTCTAAERLIYGGYSGALLYRHNPAKKIVNTMGGHNGDFAHDAALAGATAFDKANTFCRTDSAIAAAGGGNNWKALLAGQPGTMFAANTVYINRVGDFMFYTTAATDIAPVTPYTVGAAVLPPAGCASGCPNSMAWTGYNRTSGGGWRGTGESCGPNSGPAGSQWSTTLTEGSMGNATLANDRWIDDFRIGCTQYYRGLYCLQT